MILKQIALSLKNNSLTVSWLSGEANEDYNSFRSSETPVPEFYLAMRDLGVKVWRDYLKMRLDDLNFDVKDPLNNVAIIKLKWRRPAEIKDVAYFVSMHLLYHQKPGVNVSMGLPVVRVPFHRDENEKEETIREDYWADKELEQLLNRMEECGLAYAMGERAQQMLPGMEEEEK